MSRCPVVKGGRALPELSKPAGADQILSGYQAIDQEGEILTGTSPAKVLPVLSNPAQAADIPSGKQAIDRNGGKITGTHVLSVYTTAGAYASGTEEPSSYTSKTISLYVPKSFSPSNKRVEVWMHDQLFYGQELTSSDMLRVITALSFDKRVTGTIYLSGDYPGGTSSAYLRFQIPSPSVLKVAAEEAIFSPYSSVTCKRLTTTGNFKAWRNEGFYDPRVFLRFDFYDA